MSSTCKCHEWGGTVGFSGPLRTRVSGSSGITSVPVVRVRPYLPTQETGKTGEKGLARTRSSRVLLSIGLSGAPL